MYDTPEMTDDIRVEIENDRRELGGNFCRGCGQCKSKCPYELDTPALLRENYADYIRVLAGEVDVRL